MKNICFLLFALLCLQACSDDKEENWVPDSLAVTVTGTITSGEVFNAGDGQWGVNLPPEFSGTIKLDIDTDKSWNVSVDNITSDESTWITPSHTEGSGKSSIDVTIDANTVPEYRKATVVVTTAGEIPVTKKITIVQKNLGVLEIAWNRSFLLTDTEMVFGPNSRSGLVLGTCNSEGDEVQTSSSEDWATVQLENGEIKLSMHDFEGEDAWREATLSLKNLNGGITQSITVRQYDRETFIAKADWSIAANNEYTLSQNDCGMERLIDGSNTTYWERQWNDNGEGGAGGQNKVQFPYEFIIDFGEEQLFNTVDVLQRQDYHSGCIKSLKLEFSNDNTVWVSGGTHTLAQTKDECSAKKDAYSLTLPGTFEARYLKLTLLSHVGNSKQEANLAELSVFLK